MERFPADDFMFELTEDEIDVVVSQNVIPHKKYLGGAKPFAFTETGVAMLSSVLKSKTAIEMNIAIIRAFVALRKIASNYKEVLEIVIEMRSQYDIQFEEVFKALEKLINPPQEPRTRIGFYLLHLASLGVYEPVWTAAIQDEWIRILVKARPDINSAALEATQREMNRAFPGSNVTNYESLIEGLSLPDPNDRHVLAAAIKGEAQIIVTANLKDFPTNALIPHSIRAEHPDMFILGCIDRDRQKAIKALANQPFECSILKTVCNYYAFKR